MSASSAERRSGEGRPVARMAVIGLGLMGGSLGLAARQEARVDTIRGYDLDGDACALALERGAITEAARSPGEAAAGADLAVVCTPVRAIPEMVERCIADAGPDPPAAVTDIGSVKQAVYERLPPTVRRLYIGGHPICGAETRGLQGARGDLFRRATYFLCPAPETAEYVEHTVRAFVHAIGARPVSVEASAHDRLMALTSHVPHVIANILMTRVGASEHGGRRALHSVGPSFKDLTRVAGANPPLWTDIFLQNREALADSLSSLADDIKAFCAALEGTDEQKVHADALEAARYRQELLQHEDIVPETLYRVTVRIPDEPGVLSRVMSAMGDSGINIEDLTLHHFNRQTGGDLLLYVSGRTNAETAQSLLADLGFPAWISFGGGPEAGGQAR